MASREEKMPGFLFLTGTNHLWLERGLEEKNGVEGERQRGLCVDLSDHLGTECAQTHTHTELEGSDGWLGPGSMLS